MTIFKIKQDDLNFTVTSSYDVYKRMNILKLIFAPIIIVVKAVVSVIKTVIKLITTCITMPFKFLSKR